MQFVRRVYRESVQRAFLFDLDGTLVDSLEDIALALDAALIDHGLSPPTRAQVRSWIGGGVRSLVAQAVEPARVDSVLARFVLHYADKPVVHTHLYDGIAHVLDELSARGDRLAVVTNKPQALAAAICDRLLARWSFAAIVGQRDGTPPKPDPTLALAVARDIDVPPVSCVFVGDSAVDIMTGRAAQMMTVGVTWGFRPRDELVAAGAAMIVDTADGLLAV